MMNKRFISLFIIVLILVGNSGFAYAITGNPKVDWLIEEGYVQGDARGYRLGDYINRAEATKMIVEASGLGDQVLNFKDFMSMFSDMNKNHWANGYVNVAVINSLVNGYLDKTFKPNNNITYAEVIKMLVMAQGEKVDTEGFTGPYWFIPYSVRASEIGITEGVTVPDFYANATREKVFELVYNSISSKKARDLETYKGIVVENSRVSNLKGNEVRLVVFEDLNDSDANSRYKVEDKIKIIIPDDIGDTENLLGVVVDITIDQDNNAVDIALDKSYTYAEGPILASEYDVYLGTNGRYYDVYLENRRSNSNDKIYGVIHNDKSYNYEKFIYNLGRDDGNGELVFLAEFARVTIKDYKVYFIDSYSFDDIAPVSNVRYGGSEVYIYNDEKDGSSSRVSLDSVIGYTYDGGFIKLDLEDIYPGDVIHIYNKYNAIVRVDAENHGEYEKIIENQGFYFAQIDGNRYQVRESNARRPVFSLDSREYYTLYANIALEELYSLRNKDIIYHLDINNHIQSIEKR